MKVMKIFIGKKNDMARKFEFSSKNEDKFQADMQHFGSGHCDFITG